ncbi:MAG TPA: hypothetical protein VEF76_08170 [Patescibacteria group bacterium]|nr:hypothetical protein [Patescibacteria group bacterium]
MVSPRRVFRAFPLAIFLLFPTSAEAHGGIETLFFMGVVALLAVIAASILSFIVFFFGIYFIRRRRRRKKGDNSSVGKVSTVFYALIVTIVFMVFSVRWLVGNYMEDSRAESGVLRLMHDPRVTEVPPPGQVVPIRPEDAAKAKRLLKSAEKNRYDRFTLGIMYRRGEGVPQDFAEAYYWLSLSLLQFQADHMYLPGAEGARDDSKRRLTPEQVAAVDDRVMEWQKANPP